MEKKEYITPCIEIIILDNEISLALESNPPSGPGEIVFSPEFNTNQPFNTNLI